jgi:uncharacterized membrane protein YbhN (UPF0104 family)
MPRLTTVLRWSMMAVAVGLLTNLVRSGWSEIVEAAVLLATTKFGYVAAAVALEIAWTWALAQVYRSALVALGGGVSVAGAVRVSMGAFTISRIVPGGGAVGSVFAARSLISLGNPGTLTVASMVISWWVSMMSLGSLVMTGVGLGVASGIVSARYLYVPASAVIGLLLVAAIACVAARRPELRDRMLRIARMAAGPGAALAGEGSVEDVFQAAIDRLRGGRRLLPVALWGGTSWALDSLALWVIFDAFGHRLPYAVLLIGYGAANLLQALPELTPGWLGVLEGTLSMTYAAFGVPAGLAVVAVLAYRLISHWLPVAAGLPSAISMMRTHRNMTAASRPGAAA